MCKLYQLGTVRQLNLYQILCTDKGVSVFSLSRGIRGVERLVGEVGYLRQMMESMKRMITGQGLEEENGETGGQVARLEETD